MAIFLRGGMPIELTAAERRIFWSLKKNGRRDILYKEPTVQKLGKCEEAEVSWIWFAKAKCLGKYPDGSGYEEIGDEIVGMAEADGFVNTNDMVADNGIREIYQECAKLQPMTADQFFTGIVEPAQARLDELCQQACSKKKAA